MQAPARATLSQCVRRAMQPSMIASNGEFIRAKCTVTEPTSDRAGSRAAAVSAVRQLYTDEDEVLFQAARDRRF